MQDQIEKQIDLNAPIGRAVIEQIVASAGAVDDVPTLVHREIEYVVARATGHSVGTDPEVVEYIGFILSAHHKVVCVCASVMCHDHRLVRAGWTRPPRSTPAGGTMPSSQRESCSRGNSLADAAALGFVTLATAGATS